ncbi:MAG TPA: P-II family nitrogen regulator, partial [Patescibacteria group bacterium]|nr:P-II family nitrogen regulator [Patescibacteria group bacterium]
MKEIKAFIQPFMLGKVTNALEGIPEFPGMSVSDVRGFGRGKIE